MTAEVGKDIKCVCGAAKANQHTLGQLAKCPKFRTGRALRPQGRFTPKVGRVARRAAQRAAKAAAA